MGLLPKAHAALARPFLSLGLRSSSCEMPLFSEDPSKLCEPVKRSEVSQFQVGKLNVS